MRKGFILASAAAFSMVAGAAVANGGVEARQELMKSIAGNTKTIGAFVKGGKGSAADVEASAAAISADAKKIGAMFGDQIHVENAGDVKTTASPAIWQKWDGFVAIANDLDSAASALSAAAATGDADAIKAGFGPMVKTCGACHKPYRVKK